MERTFSASGRHNHPTFASARSPSLRPSASPLFTHASRATARSPPHSPPRSPPYSPLYSPPYSPGSPGASAPSSPRLRCLYITILIIVSYNLSYVVEHLTLSLLGRPNAWSRGGGARGEEEYGAYGADSAFYNAFSAAADSGDDPPTLASFTPPDLPTWDPNEVQVEVPVVFYHGRPGASPCHKSHYVYKIVSEARKHNNAVHFIGPRECRQFFFHMGVRFEEHAEYEEVYEWFIRNLGTPVDVHKFMERHNYGRIFHLATEVMLFANASQVAAWLFPNSDLALPARWPSIRPPLRPTQYSSAGVGTHIALMSYAALVDWCLFLHAVFDSALFGGDKESQDLVLLPSYVDVTIMGWYTFAGCWLQWVEPPCVSDVKPETAKALRKRGIQPRFRVQSLCQPRNCLNSSWSNEGPCVFDNNFSLTSGRPFFKFKTGDKCPSTMHYAFYRGWEEEAQTEPVQFLAVHFMHRKKEFLSTKFPPEPEKSWGSAAE
ncbi:hypothetical protein CLOM_g19080 [Closterium sp. NIES-68]|nr:hypothetical protein CLOM_g19080 [Closterium sp. NIES-68]GJP75104.1 hypothetical protein CLOP_g5592 [Closterium sp. NIES-67]